ncbi:MAG: hypothetical protein MUF84_17300 [Anaerolineae bacterium]|nr:hypothetical protein [Anaerolineae bacterium]
MIVGLGVLALSPLRLVPADGPGARRWLDPVFAQRAIDNDAYYGALARAGAYLGDNAPRDSVISVIHEGTVVGYYADRPYQMLYTLPVTDTLRVLARSEYLVYDHLVFVQQTDAEIRKVEDYIDAHFGVELDISDHRRVVVLRRYGEP